MAIISFPLPVPLKLIPSTSNPIHHHPSPILSKCDLHLLMSANSIPFPFSGIPASTPIGPNPIHNPASATNISIGSVIAMNCGIRSDTASTADSRNSPHPVPSSHQIAVPLPKIDFPITPEPPTIQLDAGKETNPDACFGIVHRHSHSHSPFSQPNSTRAGGSDMPNPSGIREELMTRAVQGQDQQDQGQGGQDDRIVQEMRCGRVFVDSHPNSVCGCRSVDCFSCIRRRLSSCYHRCLSFQCLFILLSIIEVVIACVLVWYIGWRHTKQIVDSLSYQIRIGITDNTQNNVINLLIETLDTVDTIHDSIPRTFPNLANLTTFQNTTGYLADLLNLQFRHPKLGAIGFALPNNLLMSTINFDPTFFVEVPEMDLTTGEVDAVYYQPPGPNFQTANLAADDPPFRFSVPITWSDSPAHIAEYLGKSVLAIKNNHPTQLSAYKAAIAPAARGRAVFSGLSITAVTPSHGLLQTVKAHYDSAGQVDFVGYAFVGLTHFAQCLTRVNVGPHGMGFLIQQDGLIVSSTIAAANGLPDRISMWESSSRIVQLLAEKLQDAGLIQRNLTSLAAQYPYGTDLLNTDDTVYYSALSFAGGSFHVQVQSLAQSNIQLNWLIVFVIDDSDVNGGIARTIELTCYLSIGVVGICAVVAAIVTSLTNRPLQQIISFMQQAIKVIQMEKGHKQRKEFHTLCQRWNQYTDPAGRTTKSIELGAVRGNRSGAPFSVDFDSDDSMPNAQTKALPVGMDRIDASQEPSETRTETDRSRPRIVSSSSSFATQCCSYCYSVWNDRFGFSFREIQLMQSAFGSMLHSLASRDQLEAINEAKRLFIRYHFDQTQQLLQ